MNVNAYSWMLVTLGQAAGAPEGNASSAVKVQSVWDFVLKGGPMMIPIGICSLVALALMLERFLCLRRRRVIPSRFLPGIKNILGNGNDRDEAITYCRKNGSAIANIFAAGIKKFGASVDSVEKHIQEAGEREVFKLRKNLRGLSVIASIAPLMGLLGTIFGMIKAFQTVATSSEALGKAELLAKGIYEAMITTAAGLLLAIPVLIAYHYFSSRIDQLVGEMDQITVDFVEEFAAKQQDARVTSPQLRPAHDVVATAAAAMETA